MFLGYYFCFLSLICCLKLLCGYLIQLVVCEYNGLQGLRCDKPGFSLCPHSEIAHHWLAVITSSALLFLLCYMNVATDALHSSIYRLKKLPFLHVPCCTVCQIFLLILKIILYISSFKTLRYANLTASSRNKVRRVPSLMLEAWNYFSFLCDCIIQLGIQSSEFSFSRILSQGIPFKGLSEPTCLTVLPCLWDVDSPHLSWCLWMFLQS